MKPASTLAQVSTPTVNRFTFLIHGLVRFIAAAAGPRYLEDKTAGLSLALAWCHLDRLAKRFDRLITRLRNGTLASPERPPPNASGHQSRRSSHYLDSPLSSLPKHFGWLLLLVPEASWFADRLRDMLEDPRAAEQLAAAPQIAKLFRPIGNMLGVHSDLIGSGPRGLRRPPSGRASASLSPDQQSNFIARSLGPAPNRSAAGLPVTPPPQPRRHKARLTLLPRPALLKNS